MPRIVYPQSRSNTVVCKIVCNTRRGWCAGTVVTQDALSEHARDIFCRAGAWVALDGRFRRELDLHQADRFALVADVAEVAAGFLHDLREDEFPEQDISLCF